MFEKRNDTLILWIGGSKNVRHNITGVCFKKNIYLEK
jgi:hypothetical protein